MTFFNVKLRLFGHSYYFLGCGGVGGWEGVGGGRESGGGGGRVVGVEL